ncbi:hypothetical protein Cni_G12108 [Canna indica]|uniref:Uncharacterized protein n=1 Tax=Canna indica TaxID=4628 RepID=A0AAQ3QBU3_9LILI|nr:hypothetical protein Cni_G12108 [Canna indica]
MVQTMTASAMVTDVALSPDAFLDRPPAFPAFCRLSPRISLGRDLDASSAASKAEERAEDNRDGEESGTDFEFRLHDPVAMLHADELFSDGKLVPLQLAAAKRGAVQSAAEISSPEQPKTRRRAEVPGSDPYIFSPRAPSCTSRWRELLGLRRGASLKPDQEKVSAAPAASRSKNPNPDSRSLKHLFHRNPKLSLLEPSLSLPLLRDSECEYISISARLSLSSSSSSGPDHDDLPRLSLDITDKPSHHMPTLRLVRPLPSTVEPGRSRIRRAPISETAPPPTTTAMTVPADSPRMNSSGKVVFHGLERSSSSPGSFTGGPRPRLRGMERSYSANVVRVTNVPVCSLRGSAKAGPVFGLGQLFPQQKKEKTSAAAARPCGGGKSKIEKASNSRE